VTGTGTGELVGVNEESSVGVTGVDREHPVVDILLGALALVAGGEESAGIVRVEASLEPGSLGVVVLSVSVSFGDVLQDDPPVALDVHGPGDLGIVNVGGAQVALRSDPVAGIILRGSLGSTSVVLIVKGILLVLGDVLNQIISGLIGNISVLLQEQGVLGDLVSDVVSRVLRIKDTIGKVRALSTLGRGFGITISVVRSRMVGSRVVGGGTVG